MPGLNRTGPTGQGPMTGRSMGRCTNFGANLRSKEEINSNTNEAQPDNIGGRGLGNNRGMGWGRARRRGFRGRGMSFGGRFRGGF